MKFFDIGKFFYIAENLDMSGKIQVDLTKHLPLKRVSRDGTEYSVPKRYGILFFHIAMESYPCKACFPVRPYRNVS